MNSNVNSGLWVIMCQCNFINCKKCTFMMGECWYCGGGYVMCTGRDIWDGKGNGNPLQCSFLENPRDRGAWWAAVSGVTQGQTRLKRLSSSSSSSNRGYNFLHLSTSKGCQNSLSCGPCPSLNPDWPVNTFSCCIIPISASIVMSLTLTDSFTFLFHTERPLWLHWINSRSSPYLQVSWLAISIPSATFTSLCQ